MGSMISLIPPEFFNKLRSMLVKTPDAYYSVYHAYCKAEFRESFLWIDIDSNPLLVEAEWNVLLVVRNSRFSTREGKCGMKERFGNLVFF